MKLTEFIEGIKEHDDLSIFLVEDEGFVVYYKRGDKDEVAYNVLNESIENHHWETLKEVLTGEREAIELRKVTRICGYYSAISDWNKSKRGELKARHNGNYGIPGKDCK